MTDGRAIPSPLLDHCPETLPAEAYLSPDWYAREMAAIWRRDWIYAGRVADQADNTLRSVEIGGQSVLVARGQDGRIAAFRNVCRHRGAELCGTEGRAFNGRLITCPYHAWAYDMDGRLRSTAFATPTADFDKASHGLIPVAHRIWAGCLFLSLAETPPEFAPDMGVDALDNWPMDGLVTGHVLQKDLACNWKVFWENYNECLHCPGIHPALSARVPVYQKGIMSAGETGAAPFDGPVLAGGAETWTVDGRPCGPLFPDLTAEERQTAHTFVTTYPSMFVVAHVDYVRIVSLQPLGPERTRLSAEWLFPAETLAAPGFDLANVVDFATGVLAEDGAACEMNQRGLRSDAYRTGRLMPQEFDIARFHDWLRARLDG
jgi:Rieske 2Fe-2S family protein